MSNDQNSSGNSQQGRNDFTRVSEQEQMHITGGGAAAAKPNVCKDDEYWDPVSNVCVKKNKPEGAAL